MTGSAQVVSVLDSLIQTRMHKGGVEERKRRLEEGESIQNAFKKTKKVTAGVLVGMGVHSLNNKSLQDEIRRRQMAAATEERKKQRKKKEELKSRIEKVASV